MDSELKIQRINIPEVHGDKGIEEAWRVCFKSLMSSLLKIQDLGLRKLNI